MFKKPNKKAAKPKELPRGTWVTNSSQGCGKVLGRTGPFSYEVNFFGRALYMHQNEIKECAHKKAHSGRGKVRFR